MKGEVVQSVNAPPPPPIDEYLVYGFNGEDWEWDGAYPTIERAQSYATNWTVHRIVHITDQPPKLPDHSKLMQWMIDTSDGGSEAGFAALAEHVIGWFRDGIPPELMPDEKIEGN